MVDDSTYRQTIARLHNWGNWARPGSGVGKSRCGSIEGHYVREKADDERFASSAKMPVDVVDAERVEEAVLAVRGRRMRFLLVARFVSLHRKEEICRKLSIDWGLFEASLRRCAHEVHGLLEKRRWWDVLHRASKIPTVPIAIAEAPALSLAPEITNTGLLAA